MTDDPRAGWPKTYVDEDGVEHAWTDLVPEDGVTPEDAMTYEELIREIAAAQDISPELLLGIEDGPW